MNNKMSFERWMKRVNSAIMATTMNMVSVDDLADQTWRDWFDSGMTSREAADQALDNEGFFDFVGF